LVILEMLANILLASIAIWAALHQVVVFLDICIALALILFLSNVAYCQFILKRASIPIENSKTNGSRGQAAG